MKKKQIIYLLILLLIFTSCREDYYENGKILYENRDFENALTNLKAVKEKDENYFKARKLIEKTNIRLREEFVKDSIQLFESYQTKLKENARIDSIEKVRIDSTKKIEEKNAIQNEIIRLKKELASIKTFKGSEFRGAISSLEIEVAGFSIWGKMAEKAKKSDDKTIKQLGKNIEYHLKRLQIKEFPKIRAEYAKIAKNKLWQEDINVSVFGNGNTTLQFTGGIFASNKNKQDYQNTLDEILSNFRFKRVNYKWYKYDDEYTYYKMDTDRDDKILLY